MAFSFGIPSTQSQVSPFGSSLTSTTAAPGLSSGFASSTPLGSQMGFGTALTTTTPSLFGSTMSSFAPAASTSASMFPPLGQTLTTSAPSTGFSFGGFGTATNPNTSTLGFGSSVAGVTAPSAPATVGLGGVDIQASGADITSSTGKKDKAVKETVVPNEIAATIESFKKYVKEQKAIREEMSRVSSKNITRVQSQVLALRQQLSVVANGLQRNVSAIAKLKQESAEELKNVEIAQRTKDTPPSLQYENSAPSTYFHNLAINFENQMQVYRQQIELLERHLTSLSQPSTMTPDELTVVVKRLHDAFVTLAAQLQTVHQQVQIQKEQFLAMQKASHSELGNVFENQKDNSRVLSSGYLHIPVSVGPSPVVSLPTTVALAIASAKNRTQQLQANNLILGLSASALTTGLIGGSLFTNTPSSLSGGFAYQSTTFKTLGLSGVPSFGTSGLGSVGFGSESGLSPFGVGSQKPFQLQKPPSGNKRGKRWTST